MGHVEVDCISIPLVSCRCGDAVLRSLTDVGALGLGIGDACQPSGSGHADPFVVDVLLQIGWVVKQLATAFDPVAGAVQDDRDAVDAFGVGFNEDLYLCGFLDGRQAGASGVFRQADGGRLEVVGGEDASGDGLPAKASGGGETVTAGDEFVSGRSRADGDGVQKAVFLHVVGESGDG